METLYCGGGCSIGHELCLKGVKQMKRRDYTDAVLSGLRHVTKAEKEAIRAELDGHMEDHMLTLMELGWERDEAEKRAAECMGDPAEVSRELQKCYSYGWLIVGRVLGVLLTLMVMLFVTELTGAGRSAWHNLQARLDPMGQMADSARARVKQELDIEVVCGNSIVKFYALGENERGELEVFWCVRNQQLFHYAARNIGIRYSTPEDMENELRAGGGYFSNSHVRYGNDNLELPDGTEHIVVVVSWWGEEEQFEIPIRWEVGA